MRPTSEGWPDTRASTKPAATTPSARTVQVPSRVQKAVDQTTRLFSSSRDSDMPSPPSPSRTKNITVGKASA